jgi:hypothetical protein
MKVFQMPDVLYDYLVHIVEKHGASGIHPEEGFALSKVWEAVTKNVTHIDDAQVKAMAAAGAPQGQSGTPTSETEPDLIDGTNDPGPR